MKFFIRFILAFFILITVLTLYYPFKNVLNYILYWNSQKKLTTKEIAVVIVNENGTLDNYIFAIKTVKCYCQYYGYTYVFINLKKDTNLAYNCNQDDFMFKRHCVVSNFALKYQKEIKYILFIDGDVGVVNPLKRIEDYLPKGNEKVLLYDRVYNDEIAAGSYIIKNDNYSRSFLHYFANYSYYVPDINDGTDNVALQPALLDFLGGNSYPDEYNHCMDIYFNASGFDLNMIVVTCFRYILGKLDETPNDTDYHTYDNGQIKIIKKQSLKKWVRDTWLSEWSFCENDFLHHGWKTYKIKEWNVQIFNNFNPTDSSCKSSEFINTWFFNEPNNIPCNEVKDVMDYWYDYADSLNQKNFILSNVSKFSDSIY